jgi:SpoVK/Ycf46/Vps4 family AAA+-type ATPase
VHFNKPNKENSKKIWKIQANVIGLDISDETIDEIVEHHNENGKQRASGRDIRALLKLAYRYHKHRGQTVDAEMLKQLGAFKRL